MDALLLEQKHGVLHASQLGQRVWVEGRGCKVQERLQQHPEHGVLGNQAAKQRVVHESGIVALLLVNVLDVDADALRLFLSLFNLNQPFWNQELKLVVELVSQDQLVLQAQEDPDTLVLVDVVIVVLLGEQLQRAFLRLLDLEAEVDLLQLHNVLVLILKREDELCPLDVSEDVLDSSQLLGLIVDVANVLVVLQVQQIRFCV